MNDKWNHLNMCMLLSLACFQHRETQNVENNIDYLCFKCTLPIIALSSHTCRHSEALISLRGTKKSKVHTLGWLQLPQLLRPLHICAVRSRLAQDFQDCAHTCPQTATLLASDVRLEKVSPLGMAKFYKDVLLWCLTSTMTGDWILWSTLWFRFWKLKKKNPLGPRSPPLPPFSKPFWTRRACISSIEKWTSCTCETGVYGRKWASPLRHARTLAPSWRGRCFGSHCSVDAARSQGRASLPAFVLGIWWTAVDLEGDTFRRRSRSGPFNCKCD